jgi:hypothetical protein
MGWSGAMADKAALEKIGALLFAATLLVIGLGGFAVRNQLAANEPRIETAELTQIAGGVQTVKAGFIPASMHTVK